VQQLIQLFGFIAILQLVFIPGYILLRAFRIELPILRTTILSFALSFLINYVMAYGLTLLHAYTSKTLWIVLAIEGGILLKLLGPDQTGWKSWQTQSKHVQNFWLSLSQSRGLNQFIKFGLVFTALFIIVIFVGILLVQIGQVFSAWDPVMSYNTWANQWALGHLPQDTWHYPQLIPANWSMTYLITSPASMGINLQFYAKSVMPLFPLMLMLTFIDLAIETRQVGYLLGLIFTAYFLYCFAESFGQGWVDVPMTFYAFTSLALLFLAGKSQQPLCYIALACLLTGASAVTKQAGLYILMWYPILCYVLALKPHRFKLAKTLWTLGWSWGVALLICLPWYLYIQYQIDHGTTSSELGFVTSNIYQVLGYDRSLRIIFGIFEAGFIFWILLAIASVFSCYRSTWRILILLIIPYTLIWLNYYSYATRNFTLISPLLGLLAGLALEYFYQKKSFSKLKKLLIKRIQPLNCKPLHLFIGLLVMVFLIAQVPQYSAPELIQAQILKQRQIGDASLNAMLLAYEVKHGFTGKILTSWDYIGHVPGLSQYYQPYREPGVEANQYQSSWMLNPKALSSILAQYPAHYILVANEGGLVSKAYLQYFARLEQEGAIKAVVILPQFTLYELQEPLLLLEQPHLIRYSRKFVNKG